MNELISTTQWKEDLEEDWSKRRGEEADKTRQGKTRRISKAGGLLYEQRLPVSHAIRSLIHMCLVSGSDSLLSFDA